LGHYSNARPQLDVHLAKWAFLQLSSVAYDREEGIFRNHLASFNSFKLASIRKMDVQRYVTEAAAKRAPGSVRKELWISDSTT
jgi:hypothetical protein